MPHGRLADPDATLGTDPRADPRMVEVFRRFGLDGRFPSSGLTPILRQKNGTRSPR